MLVSLYSRRALPVTWEDWVTERAVEVEPGGDTRDRWENLGSQATPYMRSYFGDVLQISLV